MSLAGKGFSFGLLGSIPSSGKLFAFSKIFLSTSHNYRIYGVFREILKKNSVNSTFYSAFPKVVALFFEKNDTFPIIAARISKMAYFKNRAFSKIGLFLKKIGLFQKFAHLKKITGSIIIGNVSFYFEKNALTFGNALYNLYSLYKRFLKI